MLYYTILIFISDGKGKSVVLVETGTDFFDLTQKKQKHFLGRVGQGFFAALIMLVLRPVGVYQYFNYFLIALYGC